MNISENSAVITRSPEETWQVASKIVAHVEKRMAACEVSSILALHGNLGSGKTCFVQGLALALDINQAVTSPTFTIVNEYKGRLPLYHIDLYRLNNPEEALGFGFEEYLEAKGIIAVEWAERACSIIPDSAINLHFEILSGADERKITIKFPPR